MGAEPHQSKLHTVYPIDKSADETGYFPCGRTQTGFEAKEIRFPEDLTCDQCILQVEWATERGKIETCADVFISGAQMPECFGKCLNGGICSNGLCSCPDNFEGTNC